MAALWHSVVRSNNTNAPLFPCCNTHIFSSHPSLGRGSNVARVDNVEKDLCQQRREGSCQRPINRRFESKPVFGMINGRSASMMSIACPCPSTLWFYCYDAFFSEAYVVNTEKLLSHNDVYVTTWLCCRIIHTKSFGIKRESATHGDSHSFPTIPVPTHYAPISSQFDKYDAFIHAPLPSDVIDITFASSIGPFCIMQCCVQDAIFPRPVTNISIQGRACSHSP